MSIVQGKTTSFITELPLGYHVFGSGGIRASDTFKAALYTSAATLSAATTAYTSTGEVVATGYTAGGIALTPTTPVAFNSVAYWGFANVSWSGVITARGALVYNATQGNRSVFVLDFGADKTSTTSFQIQFPANTYTTAILRIT